MAGPLAGRRTIGIQDQCPRHEPAPAEPQLATLEELDFQAVRLAMEAQLGGHPCAIGGADELEEQLAGSRDTSRRRPSAPVPTTATTRYSGRRHTGLAFRIVPPKASDGAPPRSPTAMTLSGPRVTTQIVTRWVARQCVLHPTLKPNLLSRQQRKGSPLKGRIPLAPQLLR